MCPVCGLPLNVAESPQANRERVYIRSLIAQGETKDQIKQALVGQFGADVLALPKSSGFDLLVYIVPVVVVLVLGAVVALLLPRWRRRSRAAVGLPSPGPALSAADAARLDDELARYDR
jgi:cytochrome c-type biogenesis protein CcmH